MAKNELPLTNYSNTFYLILFIITLLFKGCF